MSEQQKAVVVSGKAVQAVMPGSVKERLALANELAKSQLVPSCYQDCPENIVAAVQMGQELGIPPMVMLSNSYPVRNKIGMYTDLMVALCKKHPQYGGMTVNSTKDGCTVTMKRMLNNGGFEEFTSTFTVAMARAAGLIKSDGAWDKYPERMCKHRASAFVARDAFPDVLAGVYTVEELASMPDSAVEVRDVTPAPEEVSATFIDDDPDKPAAETVITEPADDPRLAELVAKAKIAKYNAKQITEIRQRWRGMKGMKRGQDAIYKAMTAELDPKVAMVQGNGKAKG